MQDVCADLPANFILQVRCEKPVFSLHIILIGLHSMIKWAFHLLCTYHVGRSTTRKRGRNESYPSSDAFSRGQQLAIPLRSIHSLQFLQRTIAASSTKVLINASRNWHRRAKPTVSYSPCRTRSSCSAPWRVSPLWQQPSSYPSMFKPSHSASTASKASPLANP